MIAFLKGKIMSVHEGSIVVLVDNVGYKVETAARFLENQNVELYIHTHVREQELRLFGFETEDEIEMFERLLGISGVGPKVALTLVGGLGLEKIEYAIGNENPHALKTTGVGIKTAEKIILELKNDAKLKKKKIYSNVSVDKSVLEEAIIALEGLGYKRYEVENEIGEISISADWGSEDIIKVLLGRFARAAKG